MKSAPELAFDYRPSRRVGAAALLICVAAVLAPWATSLPPVLRTALSLAALVVGSLAVRRLMNPRFRRIAWRESGWTLVDAAGGEHAALLESHARLGGLATLGFRFGPRSRFRALLAPDNLDAQTRRRLVLLLARGEIVQDG